MLRQRSSRKIKVSGKRSQVFSSVWFFICRWYMYIWTSHLFSSFFNVLAMHGNCFYFPLFWYSFSCDGCFELSHIIIIHFVIVIAIIIIIWAWWLTLSKGFKWLYLNQEENQQQKQQQEQQLKVLTPNTRQIWKRFWSGRLGLWVVPWRSMTWNLYFHVAKEQV